MFQRASVQIAFVVAIAAIVLFVNLGSARLWDRDEPRNAGCASEMMQRGDWIVPIFNDELRHQKPVLLYWLIGSAYAVFGVNEFAARFWSALLALASVALTYIIGRRLLNSGGALIGSLALATSLMFVVAGRAATPDSVLIFCQTLALAIYVCGTFAAKKHGGDPATLRVDGVWFPSSFPVVLALYSVMGLGVLAKGLIGVVMPMAIIGSFMLIQTQPACPPRWLEGQGTLTKFLARLVRPLAPKHFLKTFLIMRPGLALAVVAFTAGPWFAMVGWQTNGEFLKRFFVDEHIGRVTSSFENHAGGWWYYPLAIAVGFFPWSVFLLPMLLNIDRRLSSQNQQSAVFVFLSCWIGVQIGLFSLVSTKLPSYVTPCFPALAICCGSYLERLWRKKRPIQSLDRAVMIAIGCSGLGLTIGLFILCEKLLGGSFWLPALGLIWVGVSLYGWLRISQIGWRPWITVFATAAIAFCIGLFGYGTIAVSRSDQVQRLLDPVCQRDLPLATYRCLESSWIFYAGQPIVQLANDSSTANQSTRRDHFWQSKPKLAAAEYVQQNPSASIITTEQAWPELQSQLPANYQIVDSIPYFLRNKNLVLVSPQPISRIADSRPLEQRKN